MRSLSRLLLTTSITLALAACGMGESNPINKANKAASISGRQEVKLRLAHATESAGDYAGAERLLTQLAEQTPSSPVAQIELAELYKRHREDGKAIDSLNAALKIDPGNTAISRNLANTYINAGEAEKALALLDKAIAANGKDPLLYNSRGVALDQIGSYAEAQQSYKTAFNIDPAGGSMYKVNISMSYILSGDYDKAIALLRPMLDTPEAPPIVRQNLALAYGMKGESDSALKLGLQDLSVSQAQENIKFYRMLAHRGNGGSGKKASAATIPASVVKDLFPEQESTATADAAPVPEPKQPPVIVEAAPVKAVVVEEKPASPPAPVPLEKTAEQRPEVIPPLPLKPVIAEEKPTPEKIAEPTPEVIPPSPPKPIVAEEKPAPEKTAEPTTEIIPPAPARPPVAEEKPLPEKIAEKPKPALVKPAPASDKEEDDSDDNAVEEVIPSPVVKSGRKPLETMEPSSGGPEPITTAIAPDESSLPEPVLKPDKH